MKKLMTLVLGLAFVFGTVAIAQEAPAKTEKTEKKKKGGKKKTDEKKEEKK
jgi:hypothetical protein